MLKLTVLPEALLKEIDCEVRRLEASPYFFPNNSKRAELLDLMRHLYTMSELGMAVSTATSNWTNVHKAELARAGALFSFGQSDAEPVEFDD
jgi:hypothetical protein